MSTQEPDDRDAILYRNKDVVRQMLNAFNTGNPEVVRTLLHPEITSAATHPLNPEMDEHPVPERVRQEIMLNHRTFPDIHFEEEELVAEGDKVILRWRMTGTHRGPLFGRAATGRRITAVGHEIVTLQDGLIIGHVDDHANTRLQVLSELRWLDGEMLGRLGLQ
jgi:predicted ester cyclase